MSDVKSGRIGDIRSEAEYNGRGELSYRIIADHREDIKTINVPQNYSLEVTRLGNCILQGDEPYVSEKFSVRNAELYWHAS